MSRINRLFDSPGKRSHHVLLSEGSSQQPASPPTATRSARSATSPSDSTFSDTVSRSNVLREAVNQSPSHFPQAVHQTASRNHHADNSERSSGEVNSSISNNSISISSNNNNNPNKELQAKQQQQQHLPIIYINYLVGPSIAVLL